MDMCLQIAQQSLKSGAVLAAFLKIESVLEAVPDDDELHRLKAQVVHATDEVCHEPKPKHPTPTR